MIARFVEWFTSNGGVLHKNVGLFTGPQGISIKALKALPPNASIVSCPFSLAITPQTAGEPLRHFFNLEPAEQACLSERQLLCAYISLHWLIPEEDDTIPLLRHRPYVDLLPQSDQLLTPLYFSEQELKLCQGTNLYHAAVNQREALQAERMELCEVIRSACPDVIGNISWDMYLRASTYLSSRAFPSTLLSANPTLTSPTSYPVLLPGVDLINHARSHPVTWEVGFANRRSSNSTPLDAANQDAASRDKHLSISIVVNADTQEDAEIFNNYGPKPNLSFILGYGFALRDNPDDIILLKIGTGNGSTNTSTGAPHQTEYEIGRNARGADALWDDVRMRVSLEYPFVGHDNADGSNYRPNGEDADVNQHSALRDVHIDMQTSDTLLGMVSEKVRSLPPRSIDTNVTIDADSYQTIREGVKKMYEAYFSGQHDILTDLQMWLEQKDQAIVRRAQEAGFVVEDEEDS